MQVQSKGRFQVQAYFLLFGDTAIMADLIELCPTSDESMTLNITAGSSRIRSAGGRVMVMPASLLHTPPICLSEQRSPGWPFPCKHERLGAKSRAISRLKKNHPVNRSRIQAD
jgi:hypothetical protein